MSGEVAVVTEQLQAAGRQIASTVQGARDARAEPPSAVAVGHERLASALMAFNDHLMQCRQGLVDEADGHSDGLLQVATAFQQNDEQGAAQLDGAPTGPGSVGGSEGSGG